MTGNFFETLQGVVETIHARATAQVQRGGNVVIDRLWHYFMNNSVGFYEAARFDVFYQLVLAGYPLAEALDLASSVPLGSFSFSFLGEPDPEADYFDGLMLGVSNLPSVPERRALGEYVGDGADERFISVGFQPISVMIRNTGSNAGWAAPDNFTDFGFRIRYDFNANGETYDYIAYRGV